MALDLNDLILFARVVELNSFSEAARRLQMPVSTVSRRLTELENQLGHRLLERSTRRLRLTAIGAEMLDHAQRSAEISDAIAALASERSAEVSGTLRLSAPPSIADTLLAPLITAFQLAHPGVRFHIFITDRYVDHINEGIDLVFRIGAMRDSSLVARKILTYRHQLVASPAYVGTCQMPCAPQDLLRHRLLAFNHRRPQSTWDFVHVDGLAREKLVFEPQLAINDFSGLVAILLESGGIGVLPPVVQPELLRGGRLVEVMPDWRFRTFDLSLVHLSHRHMPRLIKLFGSFAADLAPKLFPALPA